MRPPSVVKLGFRVEELTGDLRVIFSYPTTRILWCCIKYQHITSQYFNRDILAAGKVLRNLDRSNYRKFVSDIHSLVSQFGRVSVEQVFLFPDSEIDHEFWGGVFQYLTGRDVLRVEEDGQVRTCGQERSCRFQQFGDVKRCGAPDVISCEHSAPAIVRMG